MTLILAIVVGVLYTAGIYMILRRNLVKVIIGLILLGHAANMLIFTIGRLTKGVPPFIEEGVEVAQMNIAEPLPQALILTAIVIGFGVQAFAIILFKSIYTETKSDDIDMLKSTDRIK